MRLAIDLGTSQVKAGTRLHRLIFPSAYARQRRVLAKMSRDNSLIGNLVIGGYWVGKSSLKARDPIFPIREGRITDYAGANLLVQGALALLSDRYDDKVIIDDLTLGTTLATSPSVTKRMERSLRGKIKITYKNETTEERHRAIIIVKDVEVMPSSLGTYYSLNYDSCIILDIGFGSVNLIAIEDGNIIYTENFYRSLDDVVLQLSREIGYPVRADNIREVLNRDEIILYGRRVKTKRAREGALRLLARGISSWVREAVEHILPATSVASSRVVATGGGAILLHPYLKIRNLIIVEDPIFANLEGMLKR